MKVYNLNIDTSQPVNQVVQMQQNQTGMLSVAISNDGKYIRNLSCEMYDGANEIQADALGDNTFGFKLDVGTEPKHVKVVAKSTPLTSTERYVVYEGTGRLRQTNSEVVQIPAGTYRQDEFLPLVKHFGYKGDIVPGVTNLVPVHLYLGTGDVGKANFDSLYIISWNPQQQLWFSNSENGGAVPRQLSPDELLVVTEDVALFTLVTYRQTGAEWGTREYPSIGYYTDYQMDTLIRPTQNASYQAGGDAPDMKCGADIDDLIGDVVDGVLQPPSRTFGFESNDITAVTSNGALAFLKGNANLTSVSLPNLTNVGEAGMYYTFAGCASLSSVELPSLATVGDGGLYYAFSNCTSLLSINLPNLTSIGAGGLSNAFKNCTSLEQASMPALTSLMVVNASGMFDGCTNLKTVDFSKVSQFGANTVTAPMFNGCTNLECVDFSEATAVPSDYASNAKGVLFKGTNTTFKIVVPDALYESWIADYFWADMADQIIKKSDYDAL